MLPTDHPRGARRHAASKEWRGEIRSDVAGKLNQFSVQQQVKAASVLAVGFQLLMSRLTLEADECFHAEFWEAGRCVQAAMLPAAVDPTATVEEMLVQIERDLADSMAAQRRLLPADVYFLTGSQIATAMQSYAQSADLVWAVSRSNGGFDLIIRYVPDLYSTETVVRWVRHYETILSSAISEPAQAQSKVSILTAEERREMIELAHGKVVSVADQHFHEVVAQQARIYPDLTAVSCDGKELTYAALMSRANKLANYLIDKGVGVEDVVGVCLDRSTDSIAALLASMIAGATYLPLDPRYAPDRLRLIVGNSQPKAIVTQQAYLQLLVTAGANSDFLIPTDSLSDDIDACSASAPSVRLMPNNLAYLIYTSGSTGQPKGVLIEHRGLSNLVRVVETGFSTGPGDRALLYHALSFDFSIWEIAMALPFGATLCMTGPSFSAFELQDFLSKNRITIASLTSSALQFIDGAEFPDLHTLTTGAEACPVETARYWAKRCRFYHGYGPTEATTGCAYEEFAGDGPVTIGWPWPNMQVHLLDAHLEPVPFGALGHIFIGGVGLARGYLGDPAMTAERFIPSPFESGARLYRSGDIARRLPDGRLVFAGRKDDQVKIGGYRVELGEIESALIAHPEVRQAVIVAMVDDDVEQLVAYFRPAGVAPPKDQTLRQFLSLRLPPYMIPTAFTALDSFPLTSSGKIDRRALRQRGG